MHKPLNLFSPGLPWAPHPTSAAVARRRLGRHHHVCCGGWTGL